MSIPPNITLRSAANADVPFLERLREITMRPIVENHYSWDASTQRARALLHLESAQIVQIEGHDIGVFKVVVAESETHLSQMQLLPAFQGKGIATFLIRELQQESARNERPITLHVLKSNRAVQLYTRLGFSTVREDEHAYTMRWQPGAGPYPTIQLRSFKWPRRPTYTHGAMQLLGDDAFGLWLGIAAGTLWRSADGTRSGVMPASVPACQGTTVLRFKPRDFPCLKITVWRMLRQLPGASLRISTKPPCSATR